MRFAMVLVLLAACSGPDEGTDPLDIRREFPEPPEGAVVWETPDWVVPAYTEKQFCYVTTYTGPDVGIRAQRNYQTQMGHHVVLFGTTASERDFADGAAFDCTTDDDLNMADMEPILIGGEIVYDDEGVLNEFVLPEGMAASLNEGQRIVVQSHYVNTTADDVLVRDAVHLEVVPESEVTTWAAPLVNTVTNFTIPANTTGYEERFDCTFEEQYTLLYLGGHLHEWGASFRTSRTRGDASEVIYEVADWDPGFRDAPMYEAFDDGEFVIEPGDTFTTSCVWDNTTDGPLAFPQEMCVTFGMIYPAKVPVICDPS